MLDFVANCDHAVRSLDFGLLMTRRPGAAGYLRDCPEAPYRQSEEPGILHCLAHRSSFLVQVGTRQNTRWVTNSDTVVGKIVQYQAVGTDDHIVSDGHIA